MRSSVCARAVSMITGIRLVRASRRNSFSTPYPSRPGNITSRMIRSGRSRSAVSVPVMPSNARIATNPTRSRLKAMRSEASCSSSTTRIVRMAWAKLASGRTGRNHPSVTILSHQILANITARLGGAGDADFHAGLDRRVDAGFHAVADHRPELHPVGVDRTPLDHRRVVAPVIAVVFGRGPRAERDVGTDDRVADIALARNIAIVVNDRVFHFGSAADITIRAD